MLQYYPWWLWHCLYLKDICPFLYSISFGLLSSQKY